MSVLNVYGYQALRENTQKLLPALRPPASTSEALGAGFDYATQTLWIGRADAVRQQARLTELTKLSSIAGEELTETQIINDYLEQHNLLRGVNYNTPLGPYFELALTERVMALPEEQQAQFDLDFETKVRTFFQEAGQDYQEVMDAATSFGRVAGMAGTLIGGALDPIMLAMSAAGGWAMIPRGLSLGRVVLAEAALGAGLETLVTPQIAEQQELAGQDFGFFDAVFNITFAGIASGGLVAAGRGVGAGARALNDRYYLSNRIFGTSPAQLRPDAELIIDNLTARLEEARMSPISEGRGFEALQSFNAGDRATSAILEGRLVEPITADVDQVNVRPIINMIDEQVMTLVRTIDDPTVRASFLEYAAESKALLTQAAKQLDDELLAALSPSGTTFKYAESIEAVRTFDERIAEVEGAVAGLRRGEPDVNLLAKYAPDKATQGRLAAIGEELATPGLPKKRRAELGQERDTVLESVKDTVDWRARREVLALKESRTKAVRKRRDLAGQLRATEDYIVMRATQEDEVVNEVATQISMVSGGRIDEGPRTLVLNSPDTGYASVMASLRQGAEQAVTPEAVKVADDARATALGPVEKEDIDVDPIRSLDDEELAEYRQDWIDVTSKIKTGEVGPARLAEIDAEIARRKAGDTVAAERSAALKEALETSISMSDRVSGETVTRSLKDWQDEIEEGRTFIEAFTECIGG